MFQVEVTVQKICIINVYQKGSVLSHYSDPIMPTVPLVERRNNIISNATQEGLSALLDYLANSLFVNKVSGIISV